MSQTNSHKLPPPEYIQIDQNQQIKDEDNCLICRLMRIRHERVDIIKWIYSSDKPSDEKASLATMMTGIKFDKEMIECLDDPQIQSFILSG
jgi:hypothetical protein